MKDENYKEAGERPAARAVKRKTEFTNVVDLAKKGSIPNFFKNIQVCTSDIIRL